MNFNNPQVRRRFVEHIGFAISAVRAAFPDEVVSEHEEIRAMRQVAEVPLMLAVLNFTLSLDYQLKNSFAPSNIPGLVIPEVG